MRRVGARGILLLLLLTVIGVAMYQRLWAVQMDLTDERHNRGVYEQLYNNALDEVAEWRNKFDAEHLRASECEQNMQQVSQLLAQKDQQIEVLMGEKNLIQQENRKLAKELSSLDTGLKAGTEVNRTFSTRKQQN